jgi:hypothetical protein
MTKLGRILKVGLLAAGALLWLVAMDLVGSALHSPVGILFAIQQPEPSLHADEAVQWSFARDSAAGAAYSDNQDKFHGPALALAARGVFALRGLSFDDATESDLRLVPFLFYLLVCAAPLALREVSWLTRGSAALLLFLSSAGCYFGHYYIQEALLVAGFVWGALLWMESAVAPACGWKPALAGAGFGLALACKVTAAAYLGVFLLTLIILARETLTWRRIAWTAAGATAVWLALQTWLFTDLNGVTAWGRQFWRSFGVASGNEETLPLTNPGYWWAVGLWLAVLVVARLVRSGTRSVRDVPLAFAVGCFLFHLALPYKTPWLLFLPVCLSLSVAWPLLAEGPVGRLAVSLSLATAFVFASGIVLERHTRTRFHGNMLTGEIAEYGASWQRANPGKPFYVAISGGHYWPLPYYLRSFQVGFGEFEGAEKAPVRFLPAYDASRPSVPGHRTYSLTVRDGEQFWLLLQDLKGVKAQLDAPGLR